MSTPTQQAPVIRSFSFGGGVQSTAALVLAAQGRIDYRTFLFANVGGTVRLLAAPADSAELLLPPHRIAALPKRALDAWCPACRDAARLLARKAQRSIVAARPDALFDL
ncbi:hypothetical protein [Kitasatospora sp. NA04385]|uniref:hypothetical protein n=1 Tax=Kitasatospora sp. NA04385 TaxID=2742135 RepID=UPI0020CB5B8F|nr:hypothetical protein [Kitasatospora sp. NA04385]